VSKGAVGNVFYIVKEGEARVVNISNSADHVLGPGDYFGERALMTGAPRSADVLADTDLVMMAIDRVSFETLLIDNILSSQLKMFSSFSSNCWNLAGSSSSESFQSTLSRRTSNVTMNSDGTTDIEDDDMTSTSPSPRLGLEAASHSMPNFKRPTNISIPNFNMSLGSLPTSTHSSAPMTPTRSPRIPIFTAPTPFLAPLSRAELELKLSELKVTKGQLGNGTFATVHLVSHVATEKKYALKVMLKSHLIANKQENNVAAEKKNMEACDYPFIVKLYRTFHDKKNLYMLMEHITGGELFDVLHGGDRRGLSPAHAKFYIAGVALGLAYLRSKDIAHRDLKPENILISSEGYPKITDFGFSKIIPSGKRTYTLCGTPEYLAPEVILSRGHTYCVDYWALGILIYELVAGYTPFSYREYASLSRKVSPTEEKLIICEKIVNGNLEFPRDFKDTVGKVN
jgi:tRNA A-37 threonylcarbamoyl transferase component Bud32